MNSDSLQPFSKRFGHTSGDREITIREDAPVRFRYALLQIATHECNLQPSTLRNIICRVLRTLPDHSNWSEYPNIWGEVRDLVEGCDWFRVYDITEIIHAFLAKNDPDRADVFESSINECFREMGIGWQLKDGIIETRGDDEFEIVINEATTELEEAELPTAKSELDEAIRDLSRRPIPDLSGAIHHAIGALECVARDVSDDPNHTLGEIIKRHPDLLPKPLNDAVSKVWGYSSEVARHVREGRDIGREEAQLVVGLAAVVSTYLVQKFRE